ncbi:MAG: cytochrome C [Planctomycetota bacterium]
MDWQQLIDIITKPDNIPIVLLAIVVPFYTWYALRQSFANDRLIESLEADPKAAKTAHRKVQPHEEGWDQKVHVWPYLLRIEFLAAIIVMVILTVWSIAFDAPLEEPANPNLTMNPSKAPWYFLGLQEMLVYFDPWIAGVMMPTLIIVGLMVIPYCDVNPLGNGYYTLKQRKFAIGIFLFGFIVLWCVLIFIGVFIRGPGWMWFWPGETWDHHRINNETFVHLPHLVGLYEDKSPVPTMLFGLVVLTGFVAGTAWVIHKLYTKYKPIEYSKMNIVQYATMQFFLITMLAMPVKILIWHVWRIKYVLITPWFNI